MFDRAVAAFCWAVTVTVEPLLAAPLPALDPPSSRIRGGMAPNSAIRRLLAVLTARFERAPAARSFASGDPYVRRYTMAGSPPQSLMAVRLDASTDRFCSAATAFSLTLRYGEVRRGAIG